MPEIALAAENLSKVYRLGQAGKRAESFVGAVFAAAAYPVRNFRHLRSLDTARATRDGADDPSILWALRDVSFEIPRGEVVGIIGRNGAGKSTLLKILSRVSEPSAGRVRLRGRISALLEVGTGFHSELTGRENVYLNGTILGMSKREIDRKFDEIADFAGIDRFLDTPVKRYSSGMTVRLGFAVAAHLDPDILIVDEVLAVGDADFQRKCMNKMQDVVSGGERTVLLVSHNMASINALAAHCLYLRGGRVAAYGPTDEVAAEYMQNAGPRALAGEPGLFTPEPGGAPRMLRSLEVLARGQRADTLVMGDDLEFRVTLDGRARPDVHAVGVRIDLETDGGARVVSLGSVHAGRQFGCEGREVVVRCDPGALPINQGQYYVRVALTGPMAAVVEDHAGLGLLNVLPADVFGAGPVLTPDQGAFYWKASWEAGAMAPAGEPAFKA